MAKRYLKRDALVPLWDTSEFGNSVPSAETEAKELKIESKHWRMIKAGKHHATNTTVAKIGIRFGIEGEYLQSLFTTEAWGLVDNQAQRPTPTKNRLAIPLKEWLDHRKEIKSHLQDNQTFLDSLFRMLRPDHEPRTQLTGLKLDCLIIRGTSKALSFKRISGTPAAFDPQIYALPSPDRKSVV